MATTRTSTLSGDGTTGTNRYATFADWLSSVPSSLVTSDTVEVLEVEHKSGGHSITAATTISKTTDATRYIEIRPASGAGHSGVADTGKAHFTSTVSASSTCMLQLQTNKVRLVGMQWFCTSSGGSSVGAIGAWATGTNGLVEIDRCIGNITGGTGSNRVVWASAGGTGGKTVVTNTLFHEQEYASNTNYTPYEGVYHNAGDLVLENNTFARCGTAVNSTNPASKSAHVRNNLVYGTGSQLAVASTITILSGSSSHNASSQATGLGGTSARTSQTFTFKATGNYKLSSSDAGALGFGTDLSADATWPVGNDIGNQARTGTWDIGADQLDPAGSITITGPAANVIGRGGLMTVAGTYTGTSSGLERRVVLTGTSTVVSGYDWASAGGTFTGGNFEFTITSVPNGGWYDCQVRFADDTAVTATSERWAQGRWIMNAGQSNGLYQLSGSSYGGVVSDDKLRTFGASVTDWGAITPPGGNETGNALIAADSVPVLIIQAAIGGTSIASWQSGQSSYTAMMAHLTDLADYGSGLDLLMWDQGEAEAQAGTSYSTHKAAIESFIASVRSDLSQASLPVIVGSLSTITGSFSATDADWNAVCRALKAVGTENANCYFVDRTDLTGTDGIHLAGAGQQAYGKRRGRAALAALGLATGNRGPRIRKIDRVDATTYDIQLTHVLGTDITPSSGITGISVEDPSNGNAALTVSSASRTGASTIRVVLSAGPLTSGTQPLFSVLRGPTAGITDPAKDNSTNALPLEYTYQQVSRTKATQVLFDGATRLESSSGTPAANATGLKWAVFQEVTPNLFTAPVAQGSAAAITGGTGTCTLDISATDLDAGATAWVDLSNSDGTTTQSPLASFFSGPVVVS